MKAIKKWGVIFVLVMLTCTGCAGKDTGDNSETASGVELATENQSRETLPDESDTAESVTVGQTEPHRVEYETRDIITYDITPDKGVKLALTQMTEDPREKVYGDVYDYYYYVEGNNKVKLSYAANSIDKPINVSINDKPVQVTGMDITKSVKPHIIVRDINKDEIPDAFIEWIGFNEIRYVVILSVDSTYQAIRLEGKDEVDDMWLIVHDDYKLQVISAEHGFDSLVDMSNDYAYYLRKTGVYNADGKMIDNGFRIDRVVSQYAEVNLYDVNGDTYLITKKHYQDGKWSLGVISVTTHSFVGGVCESKLKITGENTSLR